MKKLLYIGNKLSQHGVNQTAIETLGPVLERGGFEVFYASDKKNKLARLAHMVFATVWNIRKVDFVLIDTYSTSNFWYAIVISQICRFFKVPYIPILHGGNLPLRLDKSPRLSSAIFGHAILNVAPSGYLYGAFKSAGYANLELIPNAINIADYPFKVRDELKPKLLWVRAFAEIYNPQMAVKVLTQLLQNYPDATLCMVGPVKDSSFEDTKKLAQQLGVRIEFTGRLTKAEWTAKAKDFDIFINTTHYDNMPVSVIEAMALGLAVVSTNVGGLPFLIEHNQTGLLVSDNDVSQMTIAVQNLISNCEFSAQITQNAHLKVKNFDESEVRRQWIRILK